MVMQRAVSWSLVVASLLAPLAAQGGGGGGGRGGPGGMRGRSPEIDDRVGAFFVSATPDAVPAFPADLHLGAAPAGEVLQQLPFVLAAAGQKHRSLVYLADSATDGEKHGQFERAVFTDEVGVALRFFECVRIDLAAVNGAALRARVGKTLPGFVAFDAEGHPVGEVAMVGYKADPKALIEMLDKAVGKANKVTLQTFVKQYLGIVRDLEQQSQQEKLLDERDKKIGSGDKAKRAAMEKDRKELEAAKEKSLEQERELASKVDLPARPEGAERVGRGPGRRGR